MQRPDAKELLISIHALLAESDVELAAHANSCSVISIHALLAESDCKGGFAVYGRWEFLSTLSLRRATP